MGNYTTSKSLFALHHKNTWITFFFRCENIYLFNFSSQRINRSHVWRDKYIKLLAYSELGSFLTCYSLFSHQKHTIFILVSLSVIFKHFSSFLCMLLMFFDYPPSIVRKPETNCKTKYGLNLMGFVFWLKKYTTIRNIYTSKQSWTKKNRAKSKL